MSHVPLIRKENKEDTPKIFPVQQVSQQHKLEWGKDYKKTTGILETVKPKHSKRTAISQNSNGSVL